MQIVNNMKLWDKGFSIDKKIETFTIGHDRELDLYLAPYDVLGTMAHITMLESIDLLTKDELAKLLPELKKIYKSTVDGTFVIEDGIEDVHSQVELQLTQTLGNLGKKVHSGRSRNDQVMVDIKLYARNEIEQTVKKIVDLFNELQQQSEAYKNIIMPGYTHFQVAMPSSFGLWFGAYAESLADDLQLLLAAWHLTNQNPLGSAAGYGSSFPLNRTMTTKLLGFEDLSYNVVYAQMMRGKTERVITSAIAEVAATIGKLAMDACLYNSQNFNFIKLPDTMTTGSSIMPHKKNPDVFELIRAHCNKLQTVPDTIGRITGNLPSGYSRDMQLIKEVFIPAFSEINDILDITAYAVANINVNENIMNDKRYDLAYSVEKVNDLVKNGTPFRDAYKDVAKDIANGTFEPNKSLHHTHEGSIGNLCNAEIKNKLDKTLFQFEFDRVHQALEELIK